MILVDTDVLIAHLRGISPARDWLISSRERESLAISVLTVTELTGGMRSGETSAVRRLLSCLECLPVTELIAWHAGELMRQFHRSHSGIGVVDYVIAATAFEHGLKLATLNVRHFPMFPGLTAPFAI